MKTKTPKLPRYTGPEITFEDGQKSSLRKAGPAPKGWKYLKVGDVSPKESIVLTNDGWEGPNYCTGEVVTATSWLRAVPLKRIRKPRSVYFHSPASGNWVGKISGGVEYEYGKGGRSDTTCPKVLKCVTDGLAGGTYKKLTRAEFLAALKRFEIKEDGTKIVAEPDYKTESLSLKASLAKLEAEVASLKTFKEGVEALLRKKKD